MQTNIPDEWRQTLLDQFTWHSPETFTHEQIAAWTEIVGILNDPAFAEEALRFSPSESNQHQATLQLDTYNQQALTIIQQIHSLALQGEQPTSAGVQKLTRDWLYLLSLPMQRPLTPDFLRDLARQRPTFYNERIQRFWTLIALINGREAPASQKEGLDLLAAGLRAFVAQLENQDGLADDAWP